MESSAYGLLREELVRACNELGLPAFRARQVWHWLYEQRVERWEEMTNLPLSARAALAGAFSLSPLSLAADEQAGDGTTKFLFELADRERIETVWIPAGRRRTLCLSIQVGCRFGCVMCASGQAGFQRSLSAAEIVAQVVVAARRMGEPPTHIVFMGMGEPFDNYEAVLRTARILNDRHGLNIGARRITISTAGILPGIERLAAEGLQLELSVSLHAPDNTLRSRLVPLNRKYPLADLIEACRAYTRKTKRIVTFEYTLIGGLNDSLQDAEQLAALLKGFPCRVNLIPLSPIAEFDARAPRRDIGETFMRVLARARINATLRQSRGSAVAAACGQLRRRMAPRANQNTIGEKTE